MESTGGLIHSGSVTGEKVEGVLSLGDNGDKYGSVESMADQAVKTILKNR
jgi:hypothetical protein